MKPLFREPILFPTLPNGRNLGRRHGDHLETGRLVPNDVATSVLTLTTTIKIYIACLACFWLGFGIAMAVTHGR